jgi:hypothetical protein
VDINQHLAGHFAKEAPPPLVTAVPASRRSCVGDAALITEELDESDGAKSDVAEPDEAYINI